MNNRREWTDEDLAELYQCSKAVMMLPGVMQTLLIKLDKICADLIYLRAQVEKLQAIAEEIGLVPENPEIG